MTHPMRTKEGSSDYRYFVEPDLVPMVLDEAWVSRVRASLPELPARRRERYRAQGLNESMAAVLSASPLQLRELHESAVAEGADPGASANWVTGEVTAWVRRQDGEPSGVPIDGTSLAELVALVEAGRLSKSAAKEVLEGVLAGEGPPAAVADARNLIQITDSSTIETAVDEVLAANPKAVDGFRGGEEKVLGYLVGQVMKATHGRADPRVVDELLRSRLAD